MRILLGHCHYQQPGGEDVVFLTEGALLKARGHEVHRYELHNRDLGGMSAAGAAAATLWNHDAYRALRSLLRETGSRLAHFHNTFPLLSPASYYAARAEGVPVVQTLHNYRLVCPNAICFRDGHPCEDCIGKSIPWPGILGACYRQSRAASGVTAAMLALHRAFGTWSEMVDMYIALTDFARRKLIQGGLPADRMVVKPNFVHPDPGPGPGGEYALYVGRLSAEKGVHTLLSACAAFGGRLPLKIAGDGRMRDEVVRAAGRNKNLEFLGPRDRQEVLALMKQAYLLIFPSLWYEGFGLTIAEAFAAGLPVIASNIGVMSELVEDGRTGLHFHAGDAADLAAKIEWAVSHPRKVVQMRAEARQEYEQKYSAQQNYLALLEVYDAATQRATS